MDFRDFRQQQLEARQQLREAGTAKLEFFAGSTFKDIGASEKMIGALKAININKPSHVQVPSVHNAGQLCRAPNHLGRV